MAHLLRPTQRGRSVLKTAGGGDVKRDHIRVMGIVAHSLLMTFAVAGINLQLHARHIERTDTEATSDVAELPTVPAAREHARARGADPPAA